MRYRFIKERLSCRHLPYIFFEIYKAFLGRLWYTKIGLSVLGSPWPSQHPFCPLKSSVNNETWQWTSKKVAIKIHSEGIWVDQGNLHVLDTTVQSRKKFSLSIENISGPLRILSCTCSITLCTVSGRNFVRPHLTLIGWPEDDRIQRIFSHLLIKPLIEYRNRWSCSSCYRCYNGSKLYKLQEQNIRETAILTLSSDCATLLLLAWCRLGYYLLLSVHNSAIRCTGGGRVSDMKSLRVVFCSCVGCRRLFLLPRLAFLDFFVLEFFTVFYPGQNSSIRFAATCSSWSRIKKNSKICSKGNNLSIQSKFRSSVVKYLTLKGLVYFTSRSFRVFILYHLLEDNMLAAVGIVMVDQLKIVFISGIQEQLPLLRVRPQRRSTSS